MHRFIWKFLYSDSTKINPLQKVLNIPQIVSALLVQRGIFSFEEAKYFFRPHLNPNIHSPFLFKDIEKSVERILDALQRNENILIYGDYDVDGTTSVAILYQFLKNDIQATNNINTYIPDRNLEGYGISDKGINFIIEQDIHLVITVDCGSSEQEKISFLKSQNIDTIICDHHHLTKHIPEAIAIINPKQKDCYYPFKELCACGITLKLILALAEKINLNVQNIFLQYIDFVALATIGDVVDIKDENRIFVSEGLRKMNQNPSIPIKAIQYIQKINPPINSYHIGFSMAPLINAAGRMQHAQLSLQLLLSKSFEQAKLLASQLQSLNEQRKSLDKELLQESLTLLDIPSQKNSFTTVVYQPHWHKGILGIIASKLVEKFHKPTIVLTLQGNAWTGSGRSIEGVNLYDILHLCKDYLSHFGGHYGAAGLNIKKEKLPDFIHQFEILVADRLHHQKTLPQLEIQGELSFLDINDKFYNLIQQMQPFGKGNEEPIFYTPQAILRTKHLLKEIHTHCEWQQHQKIFKSTLFQHAEHYFPQLQIGKKYDIAYKLVMNEWKQQREIELQIIDIMDTSHKVI
ncbi:MAG: single-stranded-DNA-specific exonuclease RecJ [Chitinophagaceae bacterium]